VVAAWLSWIIVGSFLSPYLQCEVRPLVGL
jgi:hypothetical protein